MYSQWNSMIFDDFNDVPYLNYFTENSDGLFLSFNFKLGDKLIHFNDYYVLRSIDEGNALKILEQQNFDGKSWLFVLNSSDLINWFDNQSYHIHEHTYKHYILVSQHKILEILSSEKPVFIEGSIA